MEQFIANENGYKKWIKENSNGYVVNSYRHPGPNYLYLNRADCGKIKKINANANFLTIDYMKTCSLDKTELQTWAWEQIKCRLNECTFYNP